MSKNYAIYVCIAGGAILAIGLYYLLKKDTDNPPLRSSAEDKFDEKELRLKAKPLLDDYYNQAFAHYMILLCTEKNVSKELLMTIQDQYGFIPPRPFVDWSTITSSRKEDEMVELFEAEVDKQAKCDAENKFKDILINAAINK